MPPLDIPATITAVGAVITAVGVIVIGYWSYRGKERAAAAADRALVAADIAAEAKQEIVLIGDKFVLLDKRVDGRLTQLLEEVRAAGVMKADLARSEGIAQGEQAQRDRAAPAENGGAK